MNAREPRRFARRIPMSYQVETVLSDHRRHPDTANGHVFRVGRGVRHHEFVDYSWGQQASDSLIMKLPLAVSDFAQDCATDFIEFVLEELRAINELARQDDNATQGEMRARKDSIDATLVVLERRPVMRVERRSAEEREDARRAQDPEQQPPAYEAPALTTPAVDAGTEGAE